MLAEPYGMSLPPATRDAGSRRSGIVGRVTSGKRVRLDDDRVREPARDPPDLERLLVLRQRSGDIDGMVALYEAYGVLDPGDGPVIRGSAAIRAYFAGLIATGVAFEMGDQRPAAVSGDLALTSTRLSDGTVTSEIARRQPDGTWLWVVDKFSNA